MCLRRQCKCRRSSGERERRRLRRIRSKRVFSRCQRREHARNDRFRHRAGHRRRRSTDDPLRRSRSGAVVFHTGQSAASRIHRQAYQPDRASPALLRRERRRPHCELSTADGDLLAEIEQLCWRLAAPAALRRKPAGRACRTARGKAQSRQSLTNDRVQSPTHTGAVCVARQTGTDFAARCKHIGRCLVRAIASSAAIERNAQTVKSTNDPMTKLAYRPLRTARV